MSRRRKRRRLARCRLANGFVTFGCFNNYSKVTAATLKIWASLLREVPNSRLLLHSPQGSHRERALETFAAAGVEADRIEFVARVPLAEYLMRHNQIDMASILSWIRWNNHLRCAVDGSADCYIGRRNRRFARRQVFFPMPDCPSSLLTHPSNMSKLQANSQRI